MGYLIQSDYLLHIQDINLQQLISNNIAVQKQAEKYAQAKITGYLSAKYDCEEEFKETTAFSNIVTYKPNDLVVYNSELYHVSLNGAVAFNYSTLYKKNTKVYYKSSIYTCINDSIGNLPTELDFFTNDNINVVGVLPTDDTKWTKADNRSVLIYNWYVELTVYYCYTRLSPRNIPQLRIDQKNEVIADLQNAQIGVSINLYDLQSIQPKQGRTIRFNSTPKNIL